MSNCSSSCKTQDHANFGECLRAKNIRVAYCQSAKGLDYTEQKKWDKELSDYRGARESGIQPGGTTSAKIRQAVDISNETGRAFDASKPIESTTGIQGVD